jgi:hypothetical protein
VSILENYYSGLGIGLEKKKVPYPEKGRCMGERFPNAFLIPVLAKHNTSLAHLLTYNTYNVNALQIMITTSIPLLLPSQHIGLLKL